MRAPRPKLGTPVYIQNILVQTDPDTDKLLLGEVVVSWEYYEELVRQARLNVAAGGRTLLVLCSARHAAS